MSRNARGLRKTVNLLMPVYFAIAANNYYTNKENMYSLAMYDYYPTSVKRYLTVKDYRYLQEAVFKVEDYDPITKKPLI